MPLSSMILFIRIFFNDFFVDNNEQRQQRGFPWREPPPQINANQSFDKNYGKKSHCLFCGGNAT